MDNSRNDFIPVNSQCAVRDVKIHDHYIHFLHPKFFLLMKRLQLMYVHPRKVLISIQADMSYGRATKMALTI